MADSATERPECDPDLLIEELDDEFVVYCPQADRSIVLNTLGGVVLELCDGTRDRTAIVDEILGTVPAERARVTADVTQLLDELAALGFVRSGT